LFFEKWPQKNLVSTSTQISVNSENKAGDLCK